MTLAPAGGRPQVRRRIAAGIAVGMLVVAACGATPGGPSATSPGSPDTPPPATSAPPLGSLFGAGVSITSVLGDDHAVPASTTWTRILDPASPFSYEVPSTWTMHAANPWEEGGVAIGSTLAAGPDLSKISSDFSVPGIVIGVSAAAGGITSREVVEAGGPFESVCAPTPVQQTTDAGATMAYQLWQGCGGGTGVLLVLAISAAGQPGLIGIVYQGTTPDDLGYLDHIVGSIAAASVQSTPAPAATGGSVSGPNYTISMDVCQNQHGQGVSGGLITNDDTLIHSWRIVVAFSDPNGVFLNDTGWTTSDLEPGITARWQATVPSGLPAVSVSCRITRVELVR